MPGWLTVPREKVGQVFQRVDKTLALNGIEDNVFPVKEIATHNIIRTVQPAELRRRVEYKVFTMQSQGVCEESPVVVQLTRQ